MIAVTQRKQEKSNTKNSHGRQKIKRTLVGEYVMINPEIIEHSSAKQTTEEGCLSVPGILGEVERYLRVKVKYQDKNGNIGIKKVRGLDAVVVQHEIDHLDGILFTDKVIRLT
jgi:peptide deformylase